MALDPNKHKTLVRALTSRGMNIDALAVEFLDRVRAVIDEKGEDISMRDISEIQDQLTKEVEELNAQAAKKQ